MTQTVFSNEMVAHVWAQQNQDEGRSHNGQFYFEGRTLYSYGRHFVAGHWLTDKLVLLNGDSYSITTSKHMSYTARAISDADVITVDGLTSLVQSGFMVPLDEYPHAGAYRTKSEYRKKQLDTIERHLVSKHSREPHGSLKLLALACGVTSEKAQDAWAKRVTRKTNKAIADNAAHVAKMQAAMQRRDLKGEIGLEQSFVESRLHDYLDSIRSTNKWESNSAIRELNEITSKIRRLAKFAKGLGYVKQWRLLLDRANLYRNKTKNVIQVLSRHVEVREAIAVLRDDGPPIYGVSVESLATHTGVQRLQSLSWAYGVVIDEGGNALTAPRIATLKGHKARLDRLLKETVEYKRIADEKERAAIVARWLDGEHINNFYATAPSGGAYIRAENVEHDESGAIVGGILRTSQGATVPLIHAVRVFRMVKMVRASGKRWQRNGARIRVGHFEVDHIEPNGDFKAGCHRLKWFEIEPLAKSLGVFDAPALEIQHDKESA